MSIEDEPTLTIATVPRLTRRDLRVEREKTTRHVGSAAGWLAYSVAVTLVIAGAAWLASGASSTVHHVRHDAVVTVVSAS